jgi:spore cortex formation protein SpoVR/YcgB (stage V sporulation)
MVFLFYCESAADIASGSLMADAVWNVDLRGDRSLTLRYIPHNRAPLDKGRKEVLKHVHRLWGFDVTLEQQNEDGSVELLERCPTRMNTL